MMRGEYGPIDVRALRVWNWEIQRSMNEYASFPFMSAHRRVKDDRAERAWYREYRAARRAAGAEPMNYPGRKR